jgi:hypothetical protein
MARRDVNFPWDMVVDIRGLTVAHLAAMRGRLPYDFDQWDLKDKKGQTVADIIRQKGLEDRYPSLAGKKTKRRAIRAPGR